MNLQVSIIIVHYQARQELKNCLQSLEKLRDKTKFEIIVVNNDQQFLKISKKYKLIQNHANIGFGAANNLGAKKAKGKYLFFLNPDTIVLPGTIDNLVYFLESRSQAAIVSPTLVNHKGVPYWPQGEEELNPWSALWSHSILHKIWPSNPVAKKHFYQDQKLKSVRQVEAAPGAAMMIRRLVFEQVNGFDPKLFLYFEEHDLCLRVRHLGYQIYLLTKPKVVHLGSRSTKNKLGKVFKQSRFYYFNKHYGRMPAVCLELVMRLSGWGLVPILVVCFILLFNYLIRFIE